MVYIENLRVYQLLYKPRWDQCRVYDQSVKTLFLLYKLYNKKVYSGQIIQHFAPIISQDFCRIVPIAIELSMEERNISIGKT